MRWVICAVVALFLAPTVLATSAHAQDFDESLRGSQYVGPAHFTKWSGFYFGAQAGYGGGNGEFSGATNALLAYSLRETELESVANPSSWPLVGNATDTVTSYGGFIGYNTQWQDLIIGAELNYSRVNMSFNAPSTPISGLTYFAYTANGNQESEYYINAQGSASLHVTDFGALRARAGWIFNNFLPYSFVGFAVGRGNYSESAAIGGEIATTQYNGTYVPQPVLNACAPPNENSYQTSVPESCQTFGVVNTSGGFTYMYGFDAGLGIDVALTPNIFLRGEFEYVHFFPINDITVDFAQARIGAGFKF